MNGLKTEPSSLVTRESFYVSFETGSTEDKTEGAAGEKEHRP